MVGDAALGEVVGADALRAVAAADQRAPRFALLRALFGLGCVQQLGVEQLHGAGTVLQLRALVLAFDDDAARQVGQAHCGVRLVDVLAAGAGGAVGVDADVLLGDVHVFDGVLLRQHGDGAGGGVDAALAFRLRHALHAVGAGLELQAAVDALAVDAGDDLLVAAVFPGARVQDVQPPALVLGEAGVHAVQVASEDGRFVAAGAGADLQEDVAFVVRIDGNEQPAQFALDAAKPFAQLRGVLLGEFADRGVVVRQQTLCFVEIVRRFPMFLIRRHQRRQLGVLPRQAGEALAVGDHVRIGEQRRQLFVPLGKAGELGDHGCGKRHRDPFERRACATNANARRSERLARIERLN